MKTEFEKTYHEVEAVHWWFLTRRELVHQLVCRAAPDHSAAILEIGCSGGPLMKLLKADGYTNVTGIDISEKAVNLCRARDLGKVMVMDAQAPDFPPGSFDVITVSDVLEHLRESKQSIAAWHKLLRPGGTVMIFVPAFKSLWSGHDVVNQHFHRYRAAELAEMLRAAGYEIERSGYWNFSLFLPVVLLRTVKRWLAGKNPKMPSGDLKPCPEPLNSVLIGLLRLENWLMLKGLNFPFGVSAAVIARRPKSA